MTVRFPDGTTSSVELGTTAGALLQRWRPDDVAKLLAASLDGVAIDLARVIEHSGSLAPLTFGERAGRDVLQHSAAHVVAKAVTQTIDTALPIVGPPTDEGFYYDFDVRPLTADDLKGIAAAADRSVAAREPFVRGEVPREEAERIFAGNPHKLALIREIPAGETVSVYRTGDWVDLCLGPHVPDTGRLGGLHLFGASAITSESRAATASFQRVRGVAFPTHAELDSHLKLRKEAEARDHRTLGAKLELFSFDEDVPGFPFWLPNGMIVVRELERFVTEHLRESGYGEVRTPLMFSDRVFTTSGHLELFRENMFLLEVDGRPYALKPMNCPGSMLIFRSRARSYRELPLRLAEFAPLHRREASGTLHGLLRVRELVQDDAHLFVTEEQVEPEIRKLLEWIERAFSTFRLTWSCELSTRPPKFLGEPAEWDRAEATLDAVLRGAGVPYKIAPGEGGFYGPKIDIHIRDSLGRPWQTGTIQLDYQMPKRFGLEYQGPDGRLHQPIVIHRTILGTWERFVGVLLEHTNGRLPPWLATEQVRILPVGERHADAANGLRDELAVARVRAAIASPEDTIGKRVRTAEIDRVPYVVVIGDKELEAHTLAVRRRGVKEPTAMSQAEFLGHVTDRIRTRAFEP